MAILGAGGGVYRRRYSNFLHTMIYGLSFPFCASIFRWTHLILPMTFGSKLFPFSHYILQIGIYISNVPQGYFGASFQVFDLPVPNIMGTDLWPDNTCRAINDRVTLWGDNPTYLLMLISFLSSVKTFSTVLSMTNWFSWSLRRTAQIHP